MVTLPAARRSELIEAMASSLAAGPWMFTVSTGARMDRLASDLAFRMAPIAALASEITSALSPASPLTGVTGAGQGLVCTDSVCHHDHASSAL